MVLIWLYLGGNDIENSKFNIYPNDGREFDDWYDGFIEKLHTILRSIAYENVFGGEENV